MEVMEFTKFEFNDGLNITVRRGDKWHIFEHPEDGVLKSVDMSDKSSKCGVVRYCKFFKSISMSFDKIPNELLTLYHDQFCRGRIDHLFSIMKDIYPEFKIDEKVTIVFFIPDEEDDYD